jgi:PadR family transcriptional regulator, regulatory protein PadR
VGLRLVGLSENNRKAKYYTLTAAGKAQLRAESAVWRTYADAVAKVLSPG